MAEVISVHRPNEQQQPAQPPAHLVREFGRHTAAGKALFALYDKDFNGRSIGDRYHTQNKLRHQKLLEHGWTPPPKEVPKPVVERPQINYPKFGRDKHPKEAPLHSIPRRKHADQILAELEADRKTMKAHRPVPTGPLLDDKEKQRCAALMQYRGQIPAITADEMAAAAIQRGAREPVSERQELQKLFDSVMQEIEERRTFLRDMEGAGRLSREMRHQIHCEIKQRVAEMERLDQIINEREDRARREAGLPPRT